jgi:phenylpropionate dioxygenase-like ring-hydroxylating dioxygenase large terminal subunit
MSLHSPIDLEQLELSIRDPLNARFFPPEAYTSEDFFRFELAAIWEREWICVGRLEEIPQPGDYVAMTLLNEPLLIVRVDEAEVAAMSAVCRHRGMIVAEGSGHCQKAFICPYHNWAYDRRGKLIGAPEMSGVGTFDKSEIRLPRIRAELWKGFIFVNFDQDAEQLAPRLEPLEPIVRNHQLEHLRGEFLNDPEYRMYFDFDWNWKVYMDGQTECYHCDKLHGTTPCMRGLDLRNTKVGLCDSEAGLFDYYIPAKEIDVTLNHLGRAVFPPIDTLTEHDRWETHSVLIAPSVFMQLLPDSVIATSWAPTTTDSVRVKRHRLYPEATLARDDFSEVHREEQVAVREFVGQDLFAFEGVQRGLESRFAPQGPISPRESVMVAFNRWLVSRYRAADARTQPDAYDETQRQAVAAGTG